MKFLLPIEFDETNDADWKQKLSLAARLALQIGVTRDQFAYLRIGLDEPFRSYVLQRYDFLKLEKERNRQRGNGGNPTTGRLSQKANTIAQRKASIATRPYDRLATIPLETIFSNLGKVIEVSGEKVAVKSKRYKCYARKGVTCIRCGIVGSYFAAERQKNQPTERYHLNLYASVEGIETMITVDHIVPKSRIDPSTGTFGADTVNNMQPMCIVCNGLKGNKTEEELKFGVSHAEAQAKAAEEKGEKTLTVGTECDTVCT